MPELPEVETVVRGLRKPLIGKKFTDVIIHWPNSIATGVTRLKKDLPGKKILSIDRRGKYLRFNLSDNYTLFLHLKMSGDLFVVPTISDPDPHARTIFSLNNKHELRFKDPRKFGRVYLVKDPNTVIGKLGPEPLEPAFKVQNFINLFSKRKGRLKPLLLNQNFISGLGNIYVDESCFRAGIRPARKIESLKEVELVSLYKAIKYILQRAIKHNGSSFDYVYRGGNFQNHFSVYGRNGELCSKCKNEIKRSVLGGRSTHYCSFCQK